MTMYQSPDWLTQRKGSLQQGVTATTRVVLLDGHPQYRLFVTTAGGKYTCAVSQNNNGKRLDGGIHYETEEKAFTGGLDELGRKLGWIA